MKDKRIIFIIIIIYLIFFSIIIIPCMNKKVVNKDYIEEIETKLNTYEQSYSNYVLEDSLRQSDIYD